MKKYRVLLVDDEERIVNFLSSKLRVSGFEVVSASDGQDGLDKLQAQEPDLVVLDLVMPRMDGFEMLKQMRAFSAVPVIVLSARGSDVDKIKGLSLGADDYLAKPFNPDELVARIESVRRRFSGRAHRDIDDQLTLGNVTMNLRKHSVVVSGKAKNLTRIEWLLMVELARNTGRLMTYEELLSQVWGPEYRDDIQLLRTWMSRLRHKLGEEAGRGFIRTIPKTGYIVESTLVEPKAVS